ncbi:helix-turn-helix domain-containing protein [Nonomuraea sp. NPDC049714]|uniref:helix-turn-helix domain-containing protein n=1 Tax=Nonomuraea sp. NPDC049714 TaxID=3364357 RepID=UPI0037B88E43
MHPSGRRSAGAVVRSARQAQGLTLADLGQRTGYSISQVSRYERGVAPLSDTTVLRRFAAALGLPPQIFGLLPDVGEAIGGRAMVGVAAMSAPAETRQHLRPVTQSNETITLHDGSHDEGTDPMRRRTLLTAAGLSVPLSLLQRLDDALAVPPQADHAASPAELAQMLRSARRQFDASELTALIAALPGLLASAREAAEQADTSTRWVMVSASYNLATDTLNKIGKKPSARIAAERAMLYADRSEDPVAKAASARALGMMLRIQGRPDLATAVMSRGVDQLTTTGLRTTSEAATHLRLLCARAYTCAWAGDRDRALEGIAEAERAAARIPAMRPFAALYRVDIHYALGDAGTALHAARSLRTGMFSTPERRGRLHTDLARAWWQWGKPEQAAAELLTAYQHAPAEVQDRPSIRRIAAELVERHPRTPGVRQLAVVSG